MEEIFDVKPIGIRYVCDYCGKGEMVPTGKNDWSVNPPKLEHMCKKCEFKMILNEKYPLIRYTPLAK